MKYTIPPATKIGHIHLKVSDLDKAMAFYVDLLGFEVTQRYGTQAVFISAGGYHHHIGLIHGIVKMLLLHRLKAPGYFTQLFYILPVKI